MKVVRVSFAREIVSEVADVRAFANIDEISQAFSTGRKFREHASKTFLRDGFVTFRQISALYAHPNHVRVHAGARRLEPVAFDAAFINYLIPESGLWVLISLVSSG